MMLILFLVAAPLVNSDKIVNTNNGPVRGVTVADKNVESFLGIPYAEPPVGDLRFAKPVAKSSWKETLDANALPPSCIQFPEEFEPMSEDCLYLNLWVPEGGSDQKPIILFINGYVNMFGTTSVDIFDGTALSQRGDVIVVTINYRLGTLGFFSAFTDEAPGNMGMYDQLMAIKWVKDNAKHFRGDPDNIVLLGAGSGAFSVSLHMISPLSKSLFKRSILQSGSAYHPMYSDNKVQFKNSQAIASMVGCAKSEESLKKNPKEVVDCMKHLPLANISEADFNLFDKTDFLLPRIGDDFLPGNPIDLYKSGDFKKDEILLGFDKDEGSYLLLLFAPHLFAVSGDMPSFNETFAKEMFYTLTGISDTPSILQSYIDRMKDTNYFNALNEAFGGYLIKCGIIFQAEYQSMANVPVYFYLFDYRPPNSPFPEWMGVVHHDELQYIFGNPLYSQDFSAEEGKFSKEMMDIWIAFAKTGNPNAPGSDVEWPRYTAEDPKYYILGENPKVGERPDNSHCDAWRNYFGALVKK